MKINVKKYIEKYFKIRTKENGIQPLIFNEPQNIIYNAILEKEKENKPVRILLLKARQIGGSTLTEALFTAKAMTNYDISVAVIAHDDKATKGLFDMTKLFVNSVPEIIKPQIQAFNGYEVVFDTSDNKGLRSKIQCMTAGSDGLGRSRTYQYAHLSEYAWWPGDKILTRAGLMSAVPTTPKSIVIIESTANGFDDFHDLCMGALAKINDWELIFIGWHQLSSYRMPYTGFTLTEEEQQLKTTYNLDNEQLAWRRYQIDTIFSGDDKLFRQEFPANPQEAFISTGYGVFDKDKVIQRMQVVPLPIKEGYFEYNLIFNDIQNIRWVEEKGGYIKIYEDANKFSPYVIGGDTAGEGSDFFTGQVINNMTGKQVATLRHRFDEDLYAIQMYCLGIHYNKALIGIESNFSTHPIKKLQEYNYPNIYMRQTEDNIADKIEYKYGFRTTKLTKPIIISNLKQIIRDNVDSINDKETLNEMLTYVREEDNYQITNAMGGYFDDLVMALAIAYYIRYQQVVTNINQEKDTTIGGWVDNVLKQQTKKKGGFY